MAFSSFDTLLAPFVKQDELTYKEVKQSLQNFIYSINSNSRMGAEPAFSNLTLDVTPPRDLLNEPVIIGGEPQDFIYKDCQAEMDTINKVLCELMLNGDAHGKGFAYPILTYNIHDRFDFDNPNNELMWKMAGKYGYPYFANFLNSDMNPEDVRSMCPLAGSTEIFVYSDRQQKYCISDIKSAYHDHIRDGISTIKTISNGQEVNCRINKFNIPVEYEITLVNGAKIKTTANHLNKVYGKDYIQTKDLTTDDYLPFSLNKFCQTDNLTREDGILVGMFLGGGSYNGENTIVYSLNDGKKSDLIDFLYEYTPKHFGSVVRRADCTSSISGKQSCCNIYVKSPYIRGLIEQFVIGTNALEKRLDPLAFTQSLEFRMGIVEGLYKTDGGNSNRIYTSSEKMKDSLVALLATMGMVATISSDDRDGRLGTNTCYTVRYYTPRENQKTYGDVYIIDDGYMWVKIKSINYCKHNSSSTSYCLEVLDDVEPVFTLANGVVTHNCRLRLDLGELKKRNGGLFGSGDSTGSIGVVTINLPRIAYLNKNNKDEFYQELDRLLDLAKDSLEMKRKWLQENVVDTNLIPAFCTYVGTIRNHFSTIGVVGMNEMCENFSDGDWDILSDEGKEFCIEVSNHIREKLLQYQQETGNMYNYEATPAESTAYRLALKDKKVYPDIITRGTESAPYYTNSCHIPVNKIKGLKQVFDHQDDLQILFTGGTVIHIMLNSAISGEAAKQIVETVCKEYRVPYISLSPISRLCPEHGYIAEAVDECPICGARLKKYQRITGYIRCVDDYNEGKRAEFEERNQLSQPDLDL